MKILLLILAVYFFTILSKFFYFKILSQNEKRPIEFSSSIIFFMTFFLPISSIYLYFNKKFNFKIIYTEGLGIIIPILIFFSFNNLELWDKNNFEYIIFVLGSLVVFIGLLYLSTYDLIYFEIPTQFTNCLLVFTIALNILVAFIKAINQVLYGIQEFQNINIGAFDNFLAFCLVYFLIYLIVWITKEEGIGKGDADIAGIIALMLGLSSTIVFIFTFSIVGGLIAVLAILAKRKVRGLIVPMVPILLISYILSLGFADEFINLIII